MPYPFWQSRSMNWAIEPAHGNLPSRSSKSRPTTRSSVTSCAVCNESSGAMLSIGENPIDLPAKGLVNVHDLPSHGIDAEARLEALAGVLAGNRNHPSVARQSAQPVCERIDVTRIDQPAGPAFFHHPVHARSGHPCGQLRLARGHGFDQAQAECLGTADRRKAEQVAFRHQSISRGVVHTADETHATSRVIGNESLQPRPLIAISCNDQLNLVNPRDRTNQRSETLVS